MGSHQHLGNEKRKIKSLKKSLTVLGIAGIMLATPFIFTACDISKFDINGKDGVDGTIWKSGTDYAEFTDAKVGDYFIDTDDYILYQKTENAWALIMENYGKPGVNGQDGANGTNGQDGTNGSTPTIEINDEGYWVINGVVTDTKAQGPAGANGANGQDGTNGSTPTIEINDEGYWVINGVVTDTKAQGPAGANGANGQDGTNGSTPTIEINDEGYWVINGVVTDTKAQGPAGANGQDGTNGTTPTIEINDEGYWVINGVVTDTKAQGPAGANGTNGQDGTNGTTPTIEINDEGYWVINGVVTDTKAQGPAGANGQDGTNGTTPTIEINDEGYWVINGVVTDTKAQGPAGANGQDGTNGTTPTIEINDEGYWVINGVVTDVKAQGQDGKDATSVSSWDGKTAVFVGDSITYGAGCDGDKYWQILEDKLGFSKVTGMGVGKSCISATSTNGQDYSPLINRYKTIPQADLIQIFMGTNDYAFNTPLGTIDDKTDVSFYGALNVILPALQEIYPASRLVVCTPLHRYGQHGLEYDYDKNAVGYSLYDYVNAIKAVCERYGIPVIDLFNVSGINPSVAAMKHMYMPDGLHPNAVGHQLLADIMSKYLELYAIDHDTYESVKPVDEITLVRASTYYPSSSEACRLSSTYNVYLKVGQQIALKDNVNYKFFLYAQSNGTPTVVTSANRTLIMSTWTTEPYTAQSSGWYGITMAKADHTVAFDEAVISAQTLADYITIQTVKSPEEISLVRASTYYASSQETCRLSSAYNIYLEAGQTISFKDGENYKYFLYVQSNSTPTAVSKDDRLLLMGAWATGDFTVETSGWYGITIANTDHTVEFDETVTSTQTLADYITIL